MKQLSRKIISISMAFLVLFTTTSFSVGMHYCGDHLMDFSLSGNVESCMMQSEMKQSSSNCSVTEMKMDCCSDVELSVMGQDDLQASFDRLSFDQQFFVVSFVYTYADLFESRHKVNLGFKDYSPPPLIRDIQILDQTFLL